MTMNNKSDFEAVSLEFERLFQELFVKGPKGTYSEYTYIKPISGTSFDYGFLNGDGVAERWIGNAGKSPLRMNRLSFPAEPFQVSFELPVELYHGDKEGMIADVLAERINGLKTGTKGNDKIAFDTLIAGLTEESEDGTTHFATDHPAPNGGSQVNKSTGNVSSSEIRTAIQRMSGYVDRDSGAPIGGGATHIMHGPGTRFTVKEAIEAPLLTGSAGTNVAAGAVKAIENPWFKGDYANYIVVMDASSATDKPLALGVQKEWETRAYLDKDLPFYIFQAWSTLAPARGHWSKSYLITGEGA